MKRKQPQWNVLPWIVWYLQRIRDAFQEVLETIGKILQIQQLYRTVEKLSLNERQQGMIRRLTTEFYGDPDYPEVGKAYPM